MRQFLLDWGLIIFTAVLAAVAVEQAELLSRANSLSEGNEAALETVQAAHLIISPILPRDTLSLAKGYELNVRNGGATAATNVSIIPITQRLNGDTVQVLKGKSLSPVIDDLEPTEVGRQQIAIPIAEGSGIPTLNPDGAGYDFKMRGLLQYTDAFRKKHSRAYCFLFRVSEGGLILDHTSC